MSCSAYEFRIIAAHSAPIFKNVNCTYVLTMENSTRRPDFKFIAELSSLTILLINKGFRNCFKKGVYSVESDITHAYQNACKHALDLRFSNVIILEDDVHFNANCQKALREIDKFIGENAFSIYSLGSAAFTLPVKWKHHLIASPHLGGFHAVIWNVTAMLAAEQQVYLKRIDSDIANLFGLKYMYYKPIAKQLFPRTESMDEWTSRFQDVFFKITKLSTNLEPGWSLICISNYLYSIVGTITLLLALKYKNAVLKSLGGVVVSIESSILSSLTGALWCGVTHFSESF